MPSDNEFVHLRDTAPTRGMNNLDEPWRLEEGECVELTNALPGDPPTPRKGCSGQLLDSSTNWRFVPPGITFEYSGTIYILVWVYDSVADDWTLCAIPIDTTGSDVSELGVATFANTPFFGVILAHSCVYFALSEDCATWESDTKAIGNKVAEAHDTVRDMCLAEDGAVSGIAQVGDDVDGVFDVDDCFEYAFTYVRRNDAAAFTSGSTPAGMILPPNITADYEPQRSDIFLPGMVEGVESATTNRETIQISNTGTTKYYVNIDISNTHATAIEQGATHLRVYRSRAQTSIANAQAATKYWLTDLPLAVTTTTFSDQVSDATMAGRTNQMVAMNYSVAPTGQWIEYVKSRLWILNSPGIAYYSEVPGGDDGTDLEEALDYPQKFGSWFKPLEYYLDLDSVDGQMTTGMLRLGDDLYFFKERKIFCLFGGDPDAGSPTLISNSVGCAFPYTLTKCDVMGYFGKCILFLSNQGPAVIEEGGRLRKFSEFKIRELWPEYDDDGLYAELDTQYDWIIDNCTAEFWRNCWTVIYRTNAGTNRIWNYYFDPKIASDPDAPRGPWKMTLADV